MDDQIGEDLCRMLHRLRDAHENDDYNAEGSTENIKPYTNDGVPIRKLFVGNLAQRTTYKDLHKLFSTYGKIESCYLKRNSGKSNFAFVTFSNIEDALQAVKDGHRKNIHLHNRDLRVMPADSWHQPDNIENRAKNAPKTAECVTEISVEYEINEDAQIHRLNNDCLIHIFSFLPIADRVRFERVCRRWRLISHASWRSFKRLDLSQSSWGFNVSGRSAHEIDTPSLRKVLLRAGEFLTHLDFSMFAEKLSKSTMTVVGRLCPNLQYIDVTALNVSPAGIKALAQNCTKIVEFSLGNCTSTSDTDLSTLFTRNKKLRYLKLVHNSITGKCLLSIPVDSIEEIILEECNSISPCHFYKAIQGFTKLHTLSLEKCVSFNDQAVKAIGLRADSLKKLQLCRYYPMINTNTMMHISVLSNLEILNVSHNTSVEDRFLSAIGSNCKLLKEVDISACHEVTNEGLACVTSLPKLEKLTISYLGNVTDAVLTDMPLLKYLECRGCPKIDNPGLSTLIEESHNLWLMDLSGCYKVTNEFIEAAIKATKNRTNSVVCKIYVGDTGVEVSKIKKVSPLLQVLNVDLSEHYLRPDFDHNMYNFFPEELYDMYEMDEWAEFYDDSDYDFEYDYANFSPDESSFFYENCDYFRGEGFDSGDDD